MFRPDISVLRQHARSVNDSDHKNAFIETTLCDDLYEMRETYDLLCGIRGCCRCLTDVEVATAYNGENATLRQPKTSQSTIQMSQTAMRLEMCVINALGHIRTRKGLMPLFKQNIRNHRRMHSPLLSGISVYAIIFFFSILCVAHLLFLERKVQMYRLPLLYPPTDVFRKDDYRHVWENITQHHDLSGAEHEDSVKIKTFMGNDWREDFETTFNNVFISTMFDQ